MTALAAPTRVPGWPQTDLRSFLILFGALIGNAHLGGVDLFLAVVVPAYIALSLAGPPAPIPRATVLALAALAPVAILLSARAWAIQPWYTEVYGYWPLKAWILAAMVAAHPRLGWPPGNQILLLLFVAALLAPARVELGRLESVFGPNMLYRIFGAAYLIAFAAARDARGGAARHLHYAAFLACGAAVLATGSTGGLLVLALPLLMVGRRPLAAIAVLAPLIAGLAALAIARGIGPEDIASLGRLSYKLDQFETTARVVGLGALLDTPSSLWGHSHPDFEGIWRHGFDYPHNIVVELWLWFGLPGMILCAALAAGLLRGALWGGAFFLGFGGLAIGAMVSGDLAENFGLIGLALGLLLRPRLGAGGRG